MKGEKVVSCVPLASGRKNSQLSQEQILAAAGQAQDVLTQALKGFEMLHAMAMLGNAGQSEQFSLLLQQTILLLHSKTGTDEYLFDGHIDVDLPRLSDQSKLVRVRIPNLLFKLKHFHSNFPALRKLTDTELASRLRLRRATVVGQGASIQGVRLNTFYSRSVRHLPIAAAHSLRELNGLHCFSYRNAGISCSTCQDTDVPLPDNTVKINGVAVRVGEGRVTALVDAINASSNLHGVVADAQPGQHMVLLSRSGNRVTLDIAHQCGAILSGFSCGTTVIPANRNGAALWVSFRDLNKLVFDNPATAGFLCGEMKDSQALWSAALDELSITSDEEQMLALAVLSVVIHIIKREAALLQSARQHLVKPVMPQAFNGEEHSLAP